MFAEMTEKHVEAAIGAETQKAVENYGLKYNSLHEGYAVLKEEVEEAGEEQREIEHLLECIWTIIKMSSFNEDKVDGIKALKEHAENLALEACQIAAVCNKILNGLQEK